MVDYSDPFHISLTEQFNSPSLFATVLRNIDPLICAHGRKMMHNISTGSIFKYSVAKDDFS